MIRVQFTFNNLIESRETNGLPYGERNMALKYIWYCPAGSNISAENQPT